MSMLCISDKHVRDVSAILSHDRTLCSKYFGNLLVPTRVPDSACRANHITVNVNDAVPQTL